MANKELTIKANLVDDKLDINSIKVEIKGPSAPKKEATGQNIVILFILILLGIYLIVTELIGNLPTTTNQKINPPNSNSTKANFSGNSNVPFVKTERSELSFDESEL